MGLCLAIALLVIALVIQRGHRHEQRALEDRFAARAVTSAASISAYVDDVFKRETRMAASLPAGPVSDAALTHARVAQGFATSILLDGQGRLLASSPVGPSVHAVVLVTEYAHLRSALSGSPAVSGVVSSTVGPVVEFALPLDDGQRQVLSSGFALRQSPLASFIAVPAIDGAHGYILDQSGEPVVLDGTGAGPVTRDLAGQASSEGLRIASDGQLMATETIVGTPWRLVLTAPHDAVVAPVTGNDWVEWSVLGFAAAAILGGLIGLQRLSLSRKRSRDEQAASEQRFRLTVDNAPIGMLLVTLDGRILRPNARFCSMLGYASEDLASLRLIDITHDDDVDSCALLMQSLVNGEISHYEGEQRYLHSEGAAVWVRVSFSLVRDCSWRASPRCWSKRRHHGDASRAGEPGAASPV